MVESDVARKKLGQLQRWTKPGRKDLLPLFVCIPPGDAAGEIEHDYSLVNIQKTMENHHAINGKTHYFNGHFQ